MEKEFYRSDYVEFLAKELNFTKIKHDLYEKNINRCSNFQIEYVDWQREIIFTYTILVKSNNNTQKVQIRHKECLVDITFLQSYDEKGYINYLKRIILGMVTNLHNEILFNDDYGKVKDIC